MVSLSKSLNLVYTMVTCCLPGLVSGFVSLPTFMTAESSEVLWALLQIDKEVCLSSDSVSGYFNIIVFYSSTEHEGVSKIIAEQTACRYKHSCD